MVDERQIRDFLRPFSSTFHWFCS